MTGNEKQMSPDVDAAARELAQATGCLRSYRADRGQTGELRNAVRRLRALAESLPDDHPVKPAALTNLSAALLDRHRSLPGCRDDLDEAIRVAEESVRLTGPSDSWYASRINNRGSALRERYERDGVIGDLRRATEDQQALLDAHLVPASHEAMVTNNVANGLRELYEVTLDRAYLRRAAREHRAAVRLARKTPDADLARILSSAGITMRMRWPTSRGARAAIGLQEEALGRTGADDVTRPDRTGSLARSWQTLARAEHGPAALPAADQAIRHFSEAISTGTELSPNEPGWLLGRAETLELRWRLTGAPDDLRAALTGYSESLARARIRSPISAVGTALAGGLLADEAGDDRLALTFFDDGLHALGELLRGQATRTDQRSWQRHAEDLIGEACVAQTQAGDPEAAVRILDSHRAREAAFLAHAARISDSGNAPRTMAARRALDTWLDAGGPASDVPLDAILADALGPSAAEDLRLLFRSPSASGAVTETGHHVAYLVAAGRCGALLVRKPDGSVSASLLPRLTATAARRQRDRIRRGYDNRKTSPAQFEEALKLFGKWAARTVVAPLLRLVPPTGPLTLVPSGALAELPLLAAWEPTAGDGMRFPLLGRPVIFTGSLLTRRYALDAHSGPENAVAVIGDYPEHSGISLTESQAMGICGPVRQIDGTTMAPVEIMSSVQGSDLIHFSCHAAASLADAAESVIYLGGTTLTVPQILRAALPARPLVFLASCEVARPDPLLPDQTFGPPAAFLHAGARAVIAPLLAVPRVGALLLSARFYHGLSRRLPPEEALADAQRWLAGSCQRDRTEFLDGLAAELAGLGRPSDSIRWLKRVTERRHAAGSDRVKLSDWCLFTLNT